MNIEDIEVGKTYWYDDATDKENHGREIYIVEVRPDMKWEIIAVDSEDQAGSPDDEILLHPHEVSQFPLHIKPEPEEPTTWLEGDISDFEPIFYDHQARLQRLIASLERDRDAYAAAGSITEKEQAVGMIKGVRLALSYFEETGLVI